MGSDRRMLAQLEEIGVPADRQYAALSAATTLTQAGDAFADALYDWNSGAATTPELAAELAAVMTRLAAATATLTATPTEASSRPASAG